MTLVKGWGYLPGKLFIISDTHFGHDSIIGPAHRPFVSGGEMDDYMIRSWNEMVNQEDTVIHLGDFTMKTTNHAISLLRQLNGRIYFIPGNHDSWYRNASKVKQRIVEEVITILPLLTELKINGRWVTMCHYPMKEWRNSLDGGLHLHGHTHNTTPLYYRSQHGPMVIPEEVGYAFNMCVEHWSYAPVQWEIIESVVQRFENAL